MAFLNFNTLNVRLCAFTEEHFKEDLLFTLVLQLRREFFCDVITA